MAEVSGEVVAAMALYSRGGASAVILVTGNRHMDDFPSHLRTAKGVIVADLPVTRDEAEALRQDPAHWHLAVLYACRDDPRVVVRHRWLPGWSWNFANPWTAPALLAAVAAILGPSWFLVQRGAVGVAFLTAALTVIPIVLLAHWNASGPRKQDSNRDRESA